MTLLTGMALILLAIAAVAAGRMDIAILCAALKTLCVGLEFMELRHAARLHALLFVAWALAVSVALLLLC